MGFKFNGIDSTNKGLMVVSYSKPLLPPLSLSSFNIPNKSGSLLNQYKMESRVINVECIFNTSNWMSFEQKIRELSEWLYTEGVAKQLILDEEADKYYMAILNDVTDISEDSYVGKVTLNFTILDPFAYNIEEENIVWGTGTQTTVYNGGSAKVYPIISWKVISGQGLPIITNTTNGSKIEVASAIGINTNVTVDCNKGGVLLNDTTVGNDKLSLPTDFIVLEKGNNILTFNYTVTSPITIKFNKRYV